MEIVNVVLVLASLFFSLVAGYPAQRLSIREALQDPSVDPFYQPPAGFESKAPGSILRQRSVNIELLDIVPFLVQTWQLLFRTTAVNGSASVGVTTVFKPLFQKNDRFISLQGAYDSSSISCNPSYQVQAGAPQLGQESFNEGDLLEVALYLLRGYVVSLPDHEGIDAAFAAGHLEGMVTLDSMRAVIEFRGTLGIASETPMIFGDGYSGGSIATGWAASLHSSYAPELNVKGWAQGGTPANLTGVMVYNDGGPSAGFIPAAVDGLQKPSAYGAQLVPVFNEILTQNGKEVLEQVNGECASGALSGFSYQSFLATSFQTEGSSILHNPRVRPILDHNLMGSNATERPIAPVLVYHARLDEIIPYANASTLVDSWCEQGAQVQFTTFAAGGHATTVVLGIPTVAEFAEAAFAGTLPSGCSWTTVLDDIFDPLALGADLEPLMIALENAAHSMNITL